MLNFWAKVHPTQFCWLWTGELAGRMQYGRFRKESAHRVAWRITQGRIPDGLLVLHRCDIPQCVNPDHLFLGTPQDNTRDAVLKGRMAIGQQNPMCRYSEDQIRRVHHLKASGLTNRRISTETGISKGHISNLLRGWSRNGPRFLQ